MSSFFDQLRKASFKGFEFAWDREDKTGGRDVKKHKLINGKKVSYEDVGVKETAFTIEAVIGGREDFVAQAAAFEALLNEKGIGRLVLPHEGEIAAVVMDVRRRTSSNEVGIVRFSITFERVEPDSKSSFTSTSVTLKNQADTSLDAALTDFINAYNANVPDFVLDSTLAQIAGFTGGMNTALNRIGTDVRPPVFVPSDAKTFGQQIISMFTGLLLNFESPVDYTISTAATPGISDSTSNAFEVSRTLNGISGELRTIEDAVTTTGSLRAKNNTAVDLLTKIAGTSAAAKAVAYADFESKEQALNMRDSLLHNMSSLREAAGTARWSGSYTSLGSLMAAVNSDINTGLGRLPDTITIQNGSVRSSLALAHRLYGDNPAQVISKAQDIVNRNGIVHPSFAPAEDLEVLIDA
ncbi:MAG: DNA circularization N-terminal domain-containing protein [Alphaproteobacteria bacterium]|jgi:prophage DNA circulation protein|nr:DNA circularization N-terminal domain-containing protein [Alphaproteobacteria bacterium]